MNNLSTDDYAAILRLDLCAFTQRCFHELNGNSTFEANWHIELICSKLIAVWRGEIKRLIINIAPRSLKSLTASVAFPAWYLGQDPSAQIICVSYGQELADKHARDCRAVMSSPFYQAAFKTRLSEDKQAVAEFTTTKLGYRMSTSVGGTLTGRGASILILDDPLKPTDALSDAKRSSTNDWFDNTLYSRLNDKRTDRIVIITQRVHMNDLVGHVLEQEPWDVVSLPTIAQEDERHVICSPYGTRIHHRKASELLHPDREPLHEIERIRRAIGEYNFANQYLQTPAPLGGGLIKEEWFKRYAPHQKPASFDRILQSWDTASKPTQFADYSVCTTWGVKGREIYLLHVFRKQLGYPDLKRAVRDQWAQFRADVVLIEDKSSGTQLIQELTREGLYAVAAAKTSGGDKVMRMHAQTATIENGFVYLPENDHWLPVYLYELTTFPRAKNDDQVDSTSQALEWLKLSGFEPYMLQYIRREAARIKKDPEKLVTLRSPSPTSHIYLIDGRCMAVSNNGTVEVSQNDADALLRSGWVPLQAAA